MKPNCLDILPYRRCRAVSFETYPLYPIEDTSHCVSCALEAVTVTVTS